MSQAVAIGKTLILVFMSTVLAQMVAFGADIFDVGAGKWKAVLASGVAAVIVFAYNFLNPKDGRYGVSSK